MPLPPFAPLLVGVVDRASALARYADGDPGARRVDLVEARVDLFDDPSGERDAWLGACRRLEHSGTPVLVTIRLAAEGGRWSAPDAERLPLYRAAADVASWVDVEAASPLAASVTALAHARGGTTVVSHHDFARTPPLDALVAVADACRAAGGDVAKVATQVNGAADREALLALLERQPRGTCVIGMGEEAQGLRTTLPARGSLLAYGYLERPTAPGQLAAAEMDQRLRAASPAYAARRPE